MKRVRGGDAEKQQSWDSISERQKSSDSSYEKEWEAAVEYIRGLAYEV